MVEVEEEQPVLEEVAEVHIDAVVLAVVAEVVDHGTFAAAALSTIHPHPTTLLLDVVVWGE